MPTNLLASCFARTRSVVANVTPDQYHLPTPCATWDVRTLLNQIVEGANWFGLCVNAGAAPDPDPTHGVDYAAGDPLASYDEGATAAVAAFGAPGAQERMIKLPFGEMPGAVFMGIATSDVYVHGWDLARATGQPSDFDEETARLLLTGARQFADGLRGLEGQAPFGPEVEPPEGATDAERLAAYLGRTV